jgi:hypothetical protein
MNSSAVEHPLLLASTFFSSLFRLNICPHTNKPLFNKIAWGKPSNPLKEIIKGYYSDIPGVYDYIYIALMRMESLVFL